MGILTKQRFLCRFFLARLLILLVSHELQRTWNLTYIWHILILQPVQFSRMKGILVCFSQYPIDCRNCWSLIFMAPTPFFWKEWNIIPIKEIVLLIIPCLMVPRVSWCLTFFFPCNQLPSQQSSSVVDWLGGSAESIERPWPCLSRFAGLLVMSAMPSLLAESQKNWPPRWVCSTIGHSQFHPIPMEYQHFRSPWQFPL